MDGERRVITHIFVPRFLIAVIYYDVASTIHQSLPTLPSGGISANSGTVHLCLAITPRMPGSDAS